MKPPSAPQLRDMILAVRPHSKFFDPKNMQFAGDTMANYGVRAATITVRKPYSAEVESVDVWELWRRRPVRHGMQSSAYFRRGDLRQVWAVPHVTQPVTQGQDLSPPHT